MKPITPSSPVRIKVRLSIVLLLGVCLTSCATSSNQPRTAPKSPAIASPVAIPAPAPATGRNWVKVRSNPPTWYPRGTPADAPTDFRSGEWVNIGDPQGSRYFIPLQVTGAIPRQTMVNEALAARSPGRKTRDSIDNCTICLKEAGNIVVGVPLTILACYGAAAASPHQSVSGGDLEFIRPFNH